MKANVITNVLLGGVILLLVVCTAIIQMELRQSRDLMQRLIDKQVKVTVVEEPGDGATAQGTGTESTKANTKSATATTAANSTAATPQAHAPATTKTGNQAAPGDTASTQTPATSSTNEANATTATTVPMTEKQPGGTPSLPPMPSREELAAREWEQYGEQVTGIIRDLMSGQYDPVIKQFNNDFKAALTPARLANDMNSIRQAHGGFDHIVSHRPMNVSLPPDIHAFVVTTATERGEPLTFTITLDARGKIAGLYVQ